MSVSAPIVLVAVCEDSVVLLALGAVGVLFAIISHTVANPDLLLSMYFRHRPMIAVRVPISPRDKALQMYFSMSTLS